MEHRCYGSNGTTKVLREKPGPLHCVCHKFHMDWPGV